MNKRRRKGAKARRYLRKWKRDMSNSPDGWSRHHRYMRSRIEAILERELIWMRALVEYVR